MTAPSVLFDLDGTLVDSAPALAKALNMLMDRNGLPHLPLGTLRPFASSGARGMLRAALGMTPEDLGYDAMKSTFLDLYEQVMLDDVELFHGIPELIESLEVNGIRWGIVTNKGSRFACPLASHLGLTPATGCLVCGDTTPYTKPAPQPLLHAANILGVIPTQCVFVGDDERDVIAARAAGMKSVAATYGYLGIEAPPDQWGADHLVENPQSLLQLLIPPP